MRWHYAIGIEEDGSLGVYEVYVEDDEIVAFTAEPIGLGGFDDQEDLVASVVMMADDIVNYPPFNVADHRDYR